MDEAVQPPDHDQTQGSADYGGLSSEDESLTSGIDVMTHGKGTVRTKTAMRKSKLRTRKARAIAAGGNPVTV